MNQNSQRQIEINSFHEYYPLSNVPETLLLIEQECLKTDCSTNRDCTTNKETSTKEIAIALGFISALLCFAGVQLHRSINMESAEARNQTEKTFKLSPLESLSKMSPKKFVWRI